MDKSVDDARSNDSLKKALRLLSSNGLDGALMVVERELENNPESWEAWAAKADILYFQGFYESALQCCKRSLGLNPDNALAYNTQGNIFYKQGRYEEACECYTKAIEIEPMLVRAWYNKKLAVEMQLTKARPRIYLMPSRKSTLRGNAKDR
ncbi:MAG: tetratricopeptide repeat protein [Methanotrichaceae archaeon]|nr:tetratricopeptide repeat protein [Methanotrichaceae archaeon]